MRKISPPFAVDLHVHTSFSFDCVMPPRLVVEVARRRGLNAIAVTDHDTVKGGLAAIEANKDPDFLIIPGVEIKSDLGDIIGLYVTREIESRDFAGVVAEIHAQGGVAYVPHPIRTFGATGTIDIARAHPEIDLWELYNGRYGVADFAKARDAFETLGIVGPLCGSDAHFPWEIGLFRALLTDMPRSPQALLALSPDAVLQASARGDVALRVGITLGAMTKAFKRGEYGKLGRVAVSLPWKALKRSIRK